MQKETTSTSNIRTSDCCNPLTWFSLACCITYAFSELLFPGLGKVGEAGLLSVTLISFVFFGLRNPALLTPFILLGVSVLVQVTAWTVSFRVREYGFEPETTPRIDLLGKWFLFLFFALWLPRKSSGVPMMWAASIIGFFLMPWTKGLGIRELQLAINNQRIDVGTMNAQHAAMFSGILLLGSLSLFIRSSTAVTHKKILTGLATFTTLASITLLYATQTRGVWLGTAIASTSIIALYLYFSLKNKSFDAPSKLLITFMATLIITACLIAINSNLNNRIDKESRSLTLALQGKIEEMPLDSTGIRLRSWYFALPFLSERPWLGWGPDGSKLIIQESNALPPDLKLQFGHLHNTYLDIVAQYGLFGLALYLALLGWLILRIIKAFRAGVLPLSAYLFGIAFFIYWTIVNMFESYMLFSSGKYAFTVVYAGLISLTISSSATNQRPTTHHLLNQGNYES